jgi:hypothetical protein
VNRHRISRGKRRVMAVSDKQFMANRSAGV